MSLSIERLPMLVVREGSPAEPSPHLLLCLGVDEDLICFVLCFSSLCLDQFWETSLVLLQNCFVGSQPSGVRPIVSNFGFLFRVEKDL